MRFMTLLVFLLALTTPAFAQFGLIFPSDDLVSQGESPLLALQVRLFDPKEHRFLELTRPKQFEVQLFGEATDLLAGLKPAQEPKASAWAAEYTVKRPGDYLFHAEIAPRWEPAEEQFVVYHVKLCINAFGLEEGWDEPVGAEAEIVPLSRPYGLWTGNLFSGQVLVNGEPAPYVAVEIAYLGMSLEGSPPVAAPAAAYRIQTVRADASGVFHYAMPRAGWWGFAATVDADRTIKREGEEKPVSLVTSCWVQTRNMP